MTECSWPTGAQASGYFDGKEGLVSQLGASFLRKPYGDKGRHFYVFEYWCSFIARKNAENVCFIYYPNAREGTLDNGRETKERRDES